MSNKSNMPDLPIIFQIPLNFLPVIPAQAGIHKPPQVAVCYGFPPARERQ
jgi:hypothetical protein